MQTQTITFKNPFVFENQQQLPELSICYSTAGKLNAEKSNVIWVFHALTASSNVEEWWPNMVGPNKTLNSSEYFIVCANIVGSCYGTSGPTEKKPTSNLPYGMEFPQPTIRDFVKAHQLLANYLEINTIALGIGGSMGGYQAIEWAAQEPQRFGKLFLIATSAQESAWGKAIHAAQRLALENDETLFHTNPLGGTKGLAAARAFGMITYRTFEQFNATQSSLNPNENKAESYIRYQAEKLVKRFNPASYYLLNKAMDTHFVGCNQLQKIESLTSVVGISSDLLCPPIEQINLAQQLKNATYYEIESVYGHDGFLTEVQQVSALIQELLNA